MPSWMLGKPFPNSSTLSPRASNIFPPQNRPALEGSWKETCTSDAFTLSLFKSILRAPRRTFPFQVRSHRAAHSGYSLPNQPPGGFYTQRLPPRGPKPEREEPTAALPPGGAHHARRARALPHTRELPRGRAISSAAPGPSQPRGRPAAPSRPPPEAAGSRCVTAGRGRDTGALPRIAPLPSSLPEPAAGGGASPEGAAGR